MWSRALTYAGASVLGQPREVAADTLEAALGVVAVLRAAAVLVGALIHVPTLRRVPAADTGGTGSTALRQGDNKALHRIVPGNN